MRKRESLKRLKVKNFSFAIHIYGQKKSVVELLEVSLPSLLLPKFNNLNSQTPVFKSCRYCAPHCLIAKFTSSLLKKGESTNLAFLEWITREWKRKVGPNKSLSRVQTTGTMTTVEMKMKKFSLNNRKLQSRMVVYFPYFVGKAAATACCCLLCSLTLDIIIH